MGKLEWVGYLQHKDTIHAYNTEKLWMMKESYQHLLRVAVGISEHDNYWMPRKHHFCPIQWI